MILVDVLGYEGLYRVSDSGLIFSVKSNKWLKGSFDKDRYKKYRDSHKEQMKMHTDKTNSQLWTNGTESLKYSTLKNRLDAEGHRYTPNRLRRDGWTKIE